MPLFQKFVSGRPPEVDHETIFAATTLSPTSTTKLSTLNTITDMVLYHYNNLTIGFLADETGAMAKVLVSSSIKEPVVTLLDLDTLLPQGTA